MLYHNYISCQCCKKDKAHRTRLISFAASPGPYEAPWVARSSSRTAESIRPVMREVEETWQENFPPVPNCFVKRMMASCTGSS